MDRLAIVFVEMLRGEVIDQGCNGGELLRHGLRDILGHDGGSADGRRISADQMGNSKPSVPTQSGNVGRPSRPNRRRHLHAGDADLGRLRHEQNMPPLYWRSGFLIALGMMVAVATTSSLIFLRRRWL